ncbi:hypothetical protein [Streptomyces sp. CFMR 7]|uniref:hypothetical protein n=1 Tax=Streptomyces sp. CFMR 7 TaxID=1649184 RepID=UPI0011A05853|nr:hypothetical protein [Streptomyces sp. CFMR 7]
MSNNETIIASAAITKKTIVEENVTLTISKDAAEVLAVVLGSIGGDPTYSYRKYTDSMHKALQKAGFTSYNPYDRTGSPRRRITGSLSFKEGFAIKATTDGSRVRF